MKQADYKRKKRPSSCPYCMGHDIVPAKGKNMWQCKTRDDCLLTFMEKVE